MDDDDKEIDAFLDLIREAPCGRLKRGGQISLYQAIADLRLKDPKETIGPTQVDQYQVDLKLTASQETVGAKLTEGIAGMTIGFAEKARFGKKLIESYQAPAGLRPARDNLMEFVSMLVDRPPELLTRIIESLDPYWQINLIDLMQIELSKRSYELQLGQVIRGLKDQIAQEFGVGEEWTNRKKAGLNAATTFLCCLFRKLTGGPQCGLVGQLLYRANLEDARNIKPEDRYLILSRRVEQRLRRLGSAQ
jgi:hypothetical protein